MALLPVLPVHTLASLFFNLSVAWVVFGFVFALFFFNLHDMNIPDGWWAALNGYWR
jgi:hypothetical protein